MSLYRHFIERPAEERRMRRTFESIGVDPVDLIGYLKTGQPIPEQMSLRLRAGKDALARNGLDVERIFSGDAYASSKPTTPVSTSPAGTGLNPKEQKKKMIEAVRTLRENPVLRPPWQEGKMPVPKERKDEGFSIKDEYDKRGLLLSTIGVYGLYRASGIVTDFTRSPVTSWLPEALTKTMDVGRNLYGGVLLLMDAAWYPVKQGWELLYHGTQCAWKDDFLPYWKDVSVDWHGIVPHVHNILPSFGGDFWKTFGELRVLQNLESFTPPNLEGLLSAMPFVTPELAHNVQQYLMHAGQSLNDAHINPANLAIGLGVLAAEEFWRIKRRDKTIAPVTKRVPKSLEEMVHG